MSTNTYRNKEEEVYAQWLDELVIKGFVREYSYEPFSYEILPSASITSTHKLLKLSYTPDFIVTWDESAFNTFIVIDGSVSKVKGMHYAFRDDLGNYISWVDIKGVFANSKNVSGVTFPIIQKLMWYIKKIYVNKIKPLDPKGLFANTFTPVSYMYLKSRKVQTLRKTKFKLRTLNTYLDDRSKESK